MKRFKQPKIKIFDSVGQRLKITERVKVPGAPSRNEYCRRRCCVKEITSCDKSYGAVRVECSQAKHSVRTTALYLKVYGTMNIRKLIEARRHRKVNKQLNITRIYRLTKNAGIYVLRTMALPNYSPRSCLIALIICSCSCSITTRQRGVR